MSLSAMTAGATAVSASKQALRDSAVPKEYRIPSVEQSVLDVTDLPARYLSSQELAITDLDATALAEKLGRGKLKAVDVANAFFRRAAIAQETTNCLTEIFFEEGMDRAKELDSIFEQTGQPVGPLHGVPVSIKVSPFTVV
jgi:amidase